MNGAWLGELLVRLQVRYPSVPIVFAQTRALGERWTFEFFVAAAAEREVGAQLMSALVVEVEKTPVKRRRSRPTT